MAEKGIHNLGWAARQSRKRYTRDSLEWSSYVNLSNFSNLSIPSHITNAS